jgi:hypothetical protein
MEYSGKCLLLASWIRWDAQLHKELREVQIQMLTDRLVMEMSWDQMSQVYGCPSVKIERMFEAILIKITQTHGRAISGFLRQLSSELEEINPSRTQITLRKMWMN